MPWAANLSPGVSVNRSCPSRLSVMIPDFQIFTVDYSADRDCIRAPAAGLTFFKARRIFRLNLDYVQRKRRTDILLTGCYRFRVTEFSREAIVILEQAKRLKERGRSHPAIFTRSERIVKDVVDLHHAGTEGTGGPGGGYRLSVAYHRVPAYPQLCGTGRVAASRIWHLSGKPTIRPSDRLTLDDGAAKRCDSF